MCNVNGAKEKTDKEPRVLTEAEVIICRLYLDDLDEYKTCNEYKILQGLLSGEIVVDYKGNKETQ